MKIVVSQHYTMIILEKMRHDTILEMVKNYHDTIQKESNTEFMYIRKYKEENKGGEKEKMHEIKVV